MLLHERSTVMWVRESVKRIIGTFAHVITKID